MPGTCRRKRFTDHDWKRTTPDGHRDVDGVYRHLRAHGVEVEPPVDRVYGMRQVYAKDPDGYGLCFQWPVVGGPCDGGPQDGVATSD